jgi:hypothetical protein
MSVCQPVAADASDPRLSRNGAMAGSPVSVERLPQVSSDTPELTPILPQVGMLPRRLNRREPIGAYFDPIHGQAEQAASERAHM